MTVKKQYNINKDRLRALLALSAKGSVVDSGTCLSEVEMAALIDGRLPKKERETAFAHLDACPTCYSQWLSAASVLSDLEAGRDTGRGFHHRSKRYITMGVAIAASLIMFILWPLYHQPDISSVIRKQYQVAQNVSMAPAEEDFFKSFEKELKSPIIQGYGFIEPRRLTAPTDRSFISGLQSGWKLLQNDTGVLGPEGIEEKWHDYYWLGRWLVLLYAVCQSDHQMPKTFWAEQGKVAGVMQKIFLPRSDTENEANVIARSLERIEPILDHQQGMDIRACRSINSEFEIIINAICPTNQSGQPELGY